MNSTFRLLIVFQMLESAPAAGTITIQPSAAGEREEFEETANGLKPGDELVLRGGDYSQTGRRAITCRGTAAAPIVIRAAEGEDPVLTRPEDPRHRYPHNNIEVVDSEYLIIRGIHFRRGSIGIRFIRGRNITLEDCEVSETGNNAITLNSGDTDAFIIRRNHIHRTGLLAEELGETEGEGMYVGCNGARCIASNHLIEDNYIHHLRATSSGGNDGIELKYGSHGNIVRGNVIHDTVLGKRYPGILAYGVRDPEREKPNVIEGNALWSCGEGIYAIADAIVRNNIIIGSDAGIASYRHAQVPAVRNLSITHNTIAGNRGPGLRLRWQGARGMTLAGNAVYGVETAIDAAGIDGEGIAVAANVAGGALRGASLDGVRFLDGGTAVDAFAAVPGFERALDPERADLWPRRGSPLIGAGDPKHAPEFDFNGDRRSGSPDAGAYQSGGREANPGWRLRAGFKDAGATRKSR